MKRSLPPRLLVSSSLCLLLLSAPAIASSPTYEVTGRTLLRFFGRVHPMVVHFPIALLLAALCFEFLWLLGAKHRVKAQDRRAVSPAAFACLALAAFFAALGAGSGWTNAEFESHGSDLALTISWHRWLGIVAAGLALVAFLLAFAARVTKDRAAIALYRLTLLTACGVVSITGHIGGTLVFGDDYLISAFQKQAPPSVPSPPSNHGPADPSDPANPPPIDNGQPAPPDLTPDALAILADRCIRCHGPTRQRGRLRLDSLQAAVEAGVIVPGDTEASELLRRVALPAEDEAAMPPTGARLTPEQLDLLDAWIASLAVRRDPPTPSDASEPSPDPVPPSRSDADFRSPPTDAVSEADALAAIRTLGGAAGPESASSDALAVNLSVLGDRLTDATLPPLAALAPRLRLLDLSGTAITDASIANLMPCHRLEVLRLSRTSISDTSLESLATLPALTHLSLFATGISDAGLDRLASFPALREVYLGQTRVTPEAISRLAGARPALVIHTDARWPEPSAPVAAQTPACCAQAISAGRTCDHPCCMEAAGLGQVCAKCLAAR